MKNIQRPTLLLDEQKCRKNILRATQKAQKHGLVFRPHFKTHQSAAVGEWFRSAGVSRIAVSSVSMAAYFAKAGWDDITVAFPVNWLEIEEINRLAKTIRLQLLVDSTETAAFLRQHLQHPAGIFIEIDSGQQRSGIPTADFPAINALLQQINTSEHLQFKGFLTHAGHTYQAGSVSQINEIHQSVQQQMQQLRQRYSGTFPGMIISAGDTPAFSQCHHFEGFDEVRPGNMVFYDAMQALAGSCSMSDIAVAVACPVVSTNANRSQVVVYGGAVHLSKDSAIALSGNPVFGLVVQLMSNGWSEPIPNTTVAALSQEHGIIQTTPDQLSNFQTGRLTGILPVHSCLTADLYSTYQSLTGEILPKFRTVL